MSDRYTIVGTIRIDPRPNQRQPAALDDSTLERLLTGLAVSDTLRPARRRLAAERSRSPRISRHRGTALRADLDALIQELQNEWQELEAARH